MKKTEFRLNEDSSRIQEGKDSFIIGTVPKDGMLYINIDNPGNVSLKCSHSDGSTISKPLTVKRRRWFFSNDLQGYQLEIVSENIHDIREGFVIIFDDSDSYNLSKLS